MAVSLLSCVSTPPQQSKRIIVMEEYKKTGHYYGWPDLYAICKKERYLFGSLNESLYDSLKSCCSIDLFEEEFKLYDSLMLQNSNIYRKMQCLDVAEANRRRAEKRKNGDPRSYQYGGELYFKQDKGVVDSSYLYISFVLEGKFVVLDSICEKLLRFYYSDLVYEGLEDANAFDEYHKRKSKYPYLLYYQLDTAYALTRKEQKRLKYVRPSFDHFPRLR